MDYALLRAEGLRLVQELAGEVWTDYNESDPGVTILEQLCYALTDLSYRAEIPLADLLIAHPGGRIHARRQALFPAKRIFPCNPVTVNDYRKLLVDRVPGVANAWLKPRRADGDHVAGLYDIALYAPGLEPPPCTPPDEEESILGAARRVYCRHRDLCEDVARIILLRPLPTIVRGDVTIAEERTPEAILAGILFNLGDFLAPELARQPLASLVAGGAAPSAIFNGPLLTNGFIADAELQPKASEIRTQDVVRVIAQSPGVTGARNVSVEVGLGGGIGSIGGISGGGCSGNETIYVPPECIPRLDARPNGSYTIRLFRNGLEIRPEPGRVQRELDRLWAEQRRTYRLSTQYEDFFAIPAGTWRDVERYTSIQDQFPDCYGINAYGVASDEPVTREAQARQLKGYLLVFDQILADFFAQLAHVRDLYSTDPGLRHTYFAQSLEKSVPNVGPLLVEGYLPRLQHIVHSTDPFVERRNRFLDLLLALYAEELDAGSVWDLTPGDREDGDTGERLIAAKLALLHRLVVATHNRGRGMDYLERSSRGNLAGLEIKSRIQLGMNVIDQRPLVDALDELAVELVESEEEASVGRPLPRHTEVIDEQFAPLPTAAEGEAGIAPVTPIAPRAIALPARLLGPEGAVEEMRLGRLPGESHTAVVWRSPGSPEWRLAGKYADRAAAEAGGRAFAALLAALSGHAQQLYVVEHNLLRHGEVAGFDYDFTFTAVLSPPPRQRLDAEYLAFARGVLRQNAPAHLAVEVCFLRPRAMLRFEGLYWAWRQALRSGREPLLRDTSAALIRFLEGFA
jgi:hypothetical protein